MAVAMVTPKYALFAILRGIHALLAFLAVCIPVFAKCSYTAFKCPLQGLICSVCHFKAPPRFSSFRYVNILGNN